MHPIDSLRRWVPRFWRGESGTVGEVLHALLAPAELGFRAASGLRNRAYDRGWARADHGPIASISVGNIAVGGAGKTPVAAWLAARLAMAGRRPAVVLRGYGADEVEVHRELNPGIPVFAAPRRADGVRDAAVAGRDVAVLDDAFQHRAVVRDADVVLVSAESWSPRRHLLPRGPWREPAAALARADLVIVTRKSATREAADAAARACAQIARGVPVAIVHLAPTAIAPLSGEPGGLEWLRGRGVLAVASLADPEPFARQLEGLGAEVELQAYPDHHAFTKADLRTILGRSAGRPVVCTRKEAVKLRPLVNTTHPDGPDVYVLHQGVVVESGGADLDRLLGSLPSRTADADGTDLASTRGTPEAGRDARRGPA